jgi:hypothetical protein
MYFPLAGPLICCLTVLASNTIVAIFRCVRSVTLCLIMSVCPQQTGRFSRGGGRKDSRKFMFGTFARWRWQLSDYAYNRTKIPDTSYEDKRTLKLLLLVQDCDGLSTERSQLRPKSWRYEHNTPARSSVYLPDDETVTFTNTSILSVSCLYQSRIKNMGK